MGTERHRDASLLTEEQLFAHASRLSSILGWPDVVEDVYALSPLQEAMYFHAIASEADDLYVIQQRLEIEGDLDVGLFQQAWSLVVAHHPALRTVFVWPGVGRPAQIVCRGIDVAIELTDLTLDPDPALAIEAAIEVDRRTRFALDAPPVMRLLLFKTGPQLHELVWSQHHLLEDGWSATHVLQEVFETYERLVSGEATELGESRPFGDYVRWLADQDSVATEAFWREHFAGFEAPTRLSSARVADDDSTYVRISRSLERDLSDRVRAFARGHRLTLNTVLVGAMTVLLGRYVGKSDVALGVVSSGRPYRLASVESMVGMFINTLALRVPIEPDSAVVAWLREVQNRQADIIEHEYTPLTSVQGWTELGSGVTLTDTLFAFWGFGGADMAPGRTVRYRTTAGYGRTSFPISFTVEATDVISIEMDFDTSGFNKADGIALLGHYAMLLDAMVESPDVAIGRLGMLTAAEREVIESSNSTDEPAPYATVLDAIRLRAGTSPDAIAVVDGDRTTTFAELLTQGRAVAAVIRAQLGNRPGRVGIHMARSAELIAGILGVFESCGSYVPIDRHHPSRRVKFVLTDSGADLVLTDGTISMDYPVDVVDVTSLPEATSDELHAPTGPDEAYVMYTSGSTGTPKGVMVSHANLTNYVAWAHEVYGSGEPVSFPLHTSPAFDLTVTSIFVPLVSGGSIIVYPDESSRDLSVVDVFADDRVDVVKLTPSHLAVLPADQLATKRISTLVVGGEELTTELARSVVEASGGALTIFNEYGPTEATVGCMIHRFDPAKDRDTSVPIGRPIANCQIFVLDETLAAVPPGFGGDLFIGGAGVALGYQGREELTAAAFVQHPRTGHRMYRTGDRARRFSDGRLEFLGRADDQMKLRGVRIEPGEIESVLTSHDSVANAAIAIREPHPGDQRLVAYYVPTPGVTPNVTVLRDHMRTDLPDYMTPQHLVRIESLPLTSNGKLDRDALPDTIGDVTRTAGYRAPSGTREELVAKIGSELLGVDRVSMRDNFFDLGGHSILAMQFIARLHTETGRRLSPRVLLLNTLEQAAAALPQEQGAAIARQPAENDGGDEDAQTIGTSAFFFGPTVGPLFGIHYAPAVATARSTAVLICPPIGWEYMRTHWASRKVARLLVHDGYHVMRFDYFATGDSAGDSDAGSVERWIDDIRSAAAELQTVSGVERISVVGIRHGATLAALASHEGLDLESLIMWDPVVDGRQYIEALEQMHNEMLMTRGGPSVSDSASGIELLGTPYPPALRASLASLDLTANGWHATPGTVIGSQPLASHRRLVDAAGGTLEYEVLADAGGWSDLASSQSALLPTRIPARIAELLRARL